MRLMRKAEGTRDDNGAAAGADAAVAQASGSSGAPLPDDVRGRFEGSLGADLSGVRVHTGAASAAAADAVGARAYTVGNDIHFNAGQYAPTDPFGVHLLAHEVAHTVQQSSGAQRMQAKLEVSTPGDAAEGEADRAADAMVAGRQAMVTATGMIADRQIQRDPKKEPTIDSESDRAVVLAEAQARIGAACTDFKFAVTAVKQSVKDAAKLHQEIMALVADVAFSSLIPALSRAAFARITTVLKPPAPEQGAMDYAAKLAKHVAAVQNLEKIDKTLKVISDNDICKSVLTGLTKTSVLAIKNSAALFGDTDVDDFALKLKEAMGVQFQEIRTNLPSKTNAEIIAAYMMFDASETNERTYLPAPEGTLCALQGARPGSGEPPWEVAG